MDKEKLSVIVPVYNVAKYLNEGVTCLVDQTYKNIEIILVDDGSPDNCPQICDDWAKKDARIKVVHKENGGVSSARNLGLEMVTGDYITFFDPDDVIVDTMYEKLINAMQQEKSDIAMCKMTEVYETNGVEYNKNEVNLNKLKTEKIFPYLLEIGQKYKNNEIQTENIMGSVCRAVYTAKVIQGLKFENIKVYEDEVFLIDVFKTNPKVSIVDEFLYKYRQHKLSAIHQFDKEKIKNRIKGYELLCVKIKTLVSDNVFSAYMFYIYASILDELIKNGQRSKIKEVLSQEFMQGLNTKQNYKMAQKNTKYKKIKVAYWLLHYKFYVLYALILKIIKRK